MITSSIIIFCLMRDLFLSIWRAQTLSKSQEISDGTRSREEEREAHDAEGTATDSDVTVEEKRMLDESLVTHSTQTTACSLRGLSTNNPSTAEQQEMERLSVVNPAVSRSFLENLESKKILAAQSTQLGQSQNVTSHEHGESSYGEEEQWTWNSDYKENCHMSSNTDIDKKNFTMTMGKQVFEHINQPETHSQSSNKNSVNELSYDTVSERDLLRELEAFSVSELKEETVACLHRAFNSSCNPFSLVLYIVRFATFDYCSNKKSLAYVTLTEFDKWLDGKTQGLSKLEQQNLGLVPTDELKDSALEIVTTSKLMLFEPIKNIYQLDCKNNGFLEKHIRFLLHSRNKYKEAVVMATKLHLQTHFEPSEILLPLIIQDKVQLTESYVSKCPWQQKAYLSMLNRLCGLTDEELENIARSTVTPANTPENHKLTHKALVKLAERLVKMFNLDPEEYPNVFKGKNLNGLLFLLRKKYSERGLSAATKWDNLIETSIGGNQWLQLKLVECIVDLGDIDEAVRWSCYYSLPLQSLPADVQKALKHQEVELDKEDWEAEIEGTSEPVQPDQTSHQPQIQYFHQLSLPWERIRIIEDAPSLQECLSRLTQPGTVVGFDAEWRPTMCRAGSNEKLAVIQLATYSEVFILDMIAIIDSVPQKLLEEFGELLFANPNVLKLETRTVKWAHRKHHHVLTRFHIGRFEIPPNHVRLDSGIGNSSCQFVVCLQALLQLIQSLLAGYGVESDFQVLVSSCPVLKTSLRNVKRFVDLCPVSKEVLNLPYVKHKLQESRSSRMVSPAQLEKGLSELVCHCLGRPLDKTYQVSDWERRPLMADQLIYAALDAYCLLEVYDVLWGWVRESKTPVNMEPELPAWKWLFPERKRTVAQKRKRLKPGTEPNVLVPPVHTSPPIAPGEVAIVVDTMLQGLGRQLRCCGVDVVIPECNASDRQLVEIARREERTILTCGTRSYNRLRTKVPDGVCLCLPAGTIREQVTAVFRYFNVRVTTSDLFSRCQVCNGREYTKIAAEHMRIAYHVAHGLVDPHSVHVTGDVAIDYSTLTINRGVPLKVAAIPEEVMNKDRVFYCCSTCGRVFWEGSHFKTVQTQFAYIVDQSGSTETVYTKS